MDSTDPFEDPSSIAHHWDFSPGHAFLIKVHDTFNTSVNPILAHYGFSLVVSFGRATFDLSSLNVSLALSSCLGAAYDELRVSPLRGRVFIFDVCSKAVGFLITKMRSFKSKEFVCYFDLWSNGGPNWEHEEKLYYAELDRESTLIRSRSNHHNMAIRNIPTPIYRPKSVVRQAILTGANWFHLVLENMLKLSDLVPVHHLMVLQIP
jgi:hypothetical protein